MKKILMAVLAAFLTMGVVSAQADDSAAPKRRSLREMKAGVHQHKAERVKIVQKKREEMFKHKTPKTREEQLAQEVETLRKALAYSELRNEALHEVLKIGKEKYGIDLLKKAGAKQ